MFSNIRIACTLASATAMACSAAQAQDNTRYISITGNNANACTLVKPCRTMAFGIAQTPAGGELRIINSGFYGNSANIEKSLTISGGGNTVYLGVPIVINKADATVTLRDITLNGRGTVQDGIRIVTARSVHIERCTIFGFTQDGIQAAFGPFEVIVADSTSRDNGANGMVIAGGANSKLVVDNSRFDNNAFGSYGLSLAVPRATISRSTISGNDGGINVLSGTNVVITSTVVSGNGNSGVRVGAGGQATLEASTLSGNHHGLSVADGGIARISTSTFASNACCAIVNATGGVVETRGNNTVRDGISGSNPVLTPFAAR